MSGAGRGLSDAAAPDEGGRDAGGRDAGRPDDARSRDVKSGDERSGDVNSGDGTSGEEGPDAEKSGEERSGAAAAAERFPCMKAVSSVMDRADTPSGTRPAFPPGRVQKRFPYGWNQANMKKNKKRTSGWVFLAGLTY
tara:strand:- start:3805 stop:4218 length:414 start_codon:yes stop_codon:yes gene_type:complete